METRLNRKSQPLPKVPWKKLTAKQRQLLVRAYQEMGATNFTLGMLPFVSADEAAECLMHAWMWGKNGECDLYQVLKLYAQTYPNKNQQFNARVSKQLEEILSDNRR